MRFGSRSKLAVAAMAACAHAGFAQMHHVDKPEQVTRAVGVYEWTGELSKPTAMRLVPVSLYLGGALHDAGTYLARPVPFALETGNVYEIDFAGAPKGLLDVKIARDISTEGHNTDVGDASWYGYGTYAPPAKPKPSTLKPSATVAKIEGSDDDERPHFVAARPEASAGTPGGASAHAPATDDDNERPTLRHRDDGTTSGDDELNPKKKKSKRDKPQGYVTGVGSLNDDPDRPTLRHGNKDTADTPPLEGLPADMHQAVALSDPVVRDPHEFARPWTNAAERDEVLGKMRERAEQLAKSYMAQNDLVAMPLSDAPATANTPAAEDNHPKLMRTPGGLSTSTQPAAPKSTATARKGKASAPKPAAALPVQFAHEDLRGFLLSYGGLPTLIYTAAIPARPSQVTTAAADVKVTLVAQVLPTSELQFSMQSITDLGHLNRTPWMRFVDVVDADGSHRASMLFELREAHARQFALYRLVSANAEQTFVTDPML